MSNVPYISISAVPILEDSLLVELQANAKKATKASLEKNDVGIEECEISEINEPLTKIKFPTPISLDRKSNLIIIKKFKPGKY